MSRMGLALQVALPTNPRPGDNYREVNARSQTFTIADQLRHGDLTGSNPIQPDEAPRKLQVLVAAVSLSSWE